MMFSAKVLAFPLAFLLLPFSVDALADSRIRSLQDRTVQSSGSGTFKQAVRTPFVSPVSGSADGSDKIVTIDGMPAGRLEAVVLKPRPNGRQHVISSPPNGRDHRLHLLGELDAARRANAGLVTFPKNQRFVLRPPSSRGSHLEITGFEDTIIDLNGSTLEFTGVSRGLLLRDNERLLIRNGTLENRRSVIATIARVRPDAGPAGLRFEVLPEYRAALEAAGNVKLATAGPAEPAPGGGWRLRPDDHRSLFINRGGSRNTFRYAAGRFLSTRPLDQNRNFWLDAGHVWLQHENNDGPGILLLSDGEPPNRDITLESLVLRNIPGMAILGEVGRGLHVSKVSIEVAGARGAPGVFASSSDSLHINANGGDIIVENSYFGPNGDDKVNIKGNWWKVRSIDRQARRITVRPVERPHGVRIWGTAGQRLVFIDGGAGVIAESRLARDSVRGNDGGAVHTLWLDRIPGNVRVGSLLGNVDNSGPRVVIRDNVFEDSRAQGVLVQSSHVAVIDNLFAGIAGPAIKANFSLDLWYEGVDVSNVLIAENTFERSALAADKPRELIELKQQDQRGRALRVLGPIRIASNRIVAGSGSAGGSTGSGGGSTGPSSGSGSGGGASGGETPSGLPRLTIGTVEGGVFGYDYQGRNTHREGVAFAFESNGEALEFTYTGYDIDNSTEVSILLNGRRVGALSRTPNNATGGGRLLLRGQNQTPGSNTLELVQREPGWRWGVRDLLLTSTSTSSVGGGGSGGGSDGGGNSGDDGAGVDRPDLSKVEIRYENKAASVRSRQIEAQIELINRSPAPIDLDGVEVRYFVDPDGLAPEVSIRRVRPSGVKATGVWVASGRDSHVALRLQGASRLAPNASVLLRFEVEDAGGGTFDQSNDRSWIRGRSSPGPNPGLTLGVAGS